MRIHHVARDVTALNDQVEVPGIGFLPVNAFVLHAQQPLVVDTGLSLPDRGFMDALGSVIDPVDVAWIWLTHPDRDHTGAIFELLDAAPHAKVVTTYLGVGIMSLHQPLPLDRVHLLNPGQTLDLGDRDVVAFRPPLFDSPATTGLYDPRSGTCISSDCFGAPLADEELAGAPDVREVDPDDLRAGQLLWATVDSPWVHVVDPGRYAASMRVLEEFAPERVLSTHLPPAVGLTDQLLATIRLAPQADPFVGPDQRALEELLATFEPA